jgi:hypothetical protein
MTKLQEHKLAQFESQIEQLACIRKQLRVLAVSVADASASPDICDAIISLEKAGKKLLMAS